MQPSTQIIYATYAMSQIVHCVVPQIIVYSALQDIHYLLGFANHVQKLVIAEDGCFLR
jgi:hypothetical protein